MIVMLFVVMVCGMLHAQGVIDAGQGITDPQTVQAAPPPAPTEFVSPPAENGKDGQDGRDGRPGPPGRDAKLPKDWQREKPQGWSGDAMDEILLGDDTGKHAGAPINHEDAAAAIQRGNAKTEASANAHADKVVQDEGISRWNADLTLDQQIRQFADRFWPVIVIVLLIVVVVILMIWLIAALL